jgi:hypothetical protein
MKKRIAMVMAFISAFCVPLLSSCTPQELLFNLIGKVIDDSQLIVGGYPRAVCDPKSETTDVTPKDYYIYLRYGVPKAADDRSYDVAVNLSTVAIDSSFTQTKNALGDVPRFYHVESNSSSRSLADYFSGKDVVSLFTSVGPYDKDALANFTSQNYVISAPGKVFCFQTISEDGEVLQPSFSVIYREAFAWEK